MIRKIPYIWTCGDWDQCIQFMILDTNNDRIINTAWQGRAVTESVRKPKQLAKRIKEFMAAARMYHVDISHLVTKEGELIESST